MYEDEKKSRINWTNEEEQFLKEMKEIQMISSWKIISKRINEKFKSKNRTGKQCRQRYTNYLRFDEKCPKISGWEKDQDDELFRQFTNVGAKWSFISLSMPGRSENCLKNRFHGLLRKMIRRISKCQKQIKIKFKKPIKYEVLVQILVQNNKNSCEESKKIENCDQTTNFINELSKSIIKYAIQTSQQTDKQETVKLIEEIHRYNMLKKEMMIENKKLRQSFENQSCESYQKQDKITKRQTFSSDESDMDILIDYNEFEDSQLDLQEINEINNLKKEQESLWNIMGLGDEVCGIGTQKLFFF